jgi:hypothetical protein
MQVPGLWVLALASAATTPVQTRRVQESLQDHVSLVQASKAFLSRRQQKDNQTPGSDPDYGLHIGSPVAYNAHDPILVKEHDNWEFPDPDKDQNPYNWSTWMALHPMTGPHAFPTPGPDYGTVIVQHGTIDVDIDRIWHGFHKGDISVHARPAPACKDSPFCIQGLMKPNASSNKYFSVDAGPAGHEIWPGWSSFSEVWDDGQCPNLGNQHSNNLQQCYTICEGTRKCNAVAHNNANGDCVLRGCGFPIPQPKRHLVGYRGHRNQPVQKDLPLTPGIAAEVEKFLNMTGYYNNLQGKIVFNNQTEELEAKGKLDDIRAAAWRSVSTEALEHEVRKVNEMLLGYKLVTPAPNLVEVRTQAIQARGTFQCHLYTAGQNNEWCRNRDQKVFDSYEFMFVDEPSPEMMPCGAGCWCCKRQVWTQQQPVVKYNTQLLSEPSMFGAWQCHNYNAIQDEGWCMSRGDQIILGWQYRFVQREGIIPPTCGGCACCRRELQQVGR